MSRRTWTYPQLRDAAERFAAGESWESIGKSYGVAGNVVRCSVNQRGLKIERDESFRPKRKTDKDNQLYLKAIALRNTEGLSWSLIAERVGWKKRPHTLSRLCYRFVEEGGGKVARGFPKKRKSKWSPK